MGVSENRLVPLNPMVLLIIIPFLNGYFIGKINPTFSHKPIYFISPRLPQASSTSPAVASAVVSAAAVASAEADGGGADGGASSEGFRGGSWQVMGISWESNGNIMGRSWDHGNIMGSWEYNGNIMGISWEYHGNMVD